MDNYCEEVPVCSRSGKFSYTYRQAKLELFRMRREGYSLKGFHLEVYYCNLCQRFHIGSQANRIRRDSHKTKPKNTDLDSDDSSN